MEYRSATFHVPYSATKAMMEPCNEALGLRRSVPRASGWEVGRRARVLPGRQRPRPAEPNYHNCGLCSQSGGLGSLRGGCRARFSEAESSHSSRQGDGRFRSHMRGPMWSSGTSVAKREGSQIEGLRPQQRPYRADADMTAIVELGAGSPASAEEIIAALDQPAHPLFIGRSSCPPASKLAGRLLDAPSLEAAVQCGSPAAADLWVRSRRP
jgi:CRISPR-associated protein (Cas_Cas5)